MTSEALADRIKSLENKLEKLKAKLKRIEEARSYNYDSHNPYCYNEFDYKRVSKEIEQYVDHIIEDKKKLKQRKVIENNRNIKPILDFLDIWYDNNYKWYLERYEKYKIEKEKYKKEREAWIKEADKYRYGSPERQSIRKKLYLGDKAFGEKWDYIIELEGDNFEEKLEKELRAEYNSKYDLLIAKVEEVTGEIIDAIYLHVADDGELNGVITGKKGKARISTFSAGGWNVQRFHYRTKVEEYKEETV